MQNIIRETQRFITVRKHFLLDAEPHVHERIELIYIKSGNGTAVCDGKEYAFSAGSFFIVFPNQVHAYSGYDGASGNEFYKVIISPEHLLALSGTFLNFIPISPIYTPGDNALMQILELLFERYEATAPAEVVSGLLTALFGELLPRLELQKRNLHTDRISEVLHFCQEHYLEEITSSRLERELYISRSYLSYIFNKKLNISFPDYVNSLRLSHALKLLQRGEESISEAAIKSGFTGVRNFNHAFRRRYGMTPSEYLGRTT